MINVGDTVKVIGKTMCGEAEMECIPVGTICEVIDVEDGDNERIVGVQPIYDYHYPFWYLEKDLEKGRLEWIKDE